MEEPIEEPVAEEQEEEKEEEEEEIIEEEEDSDDGSIDQYDWAPRAEIEDRAIECQCIPKTSGVPSMLYDEVKCQHNRTGNKGVSGFQGNWHRPGRLPIIDDLRYLRKLPLVPEKDYTYMLGYPLSQGTIQHANVLSEEDGKTDEEVAVEPEEPPQEEQEEGGGSPEYDEELDDQFIDVAPLGEKDATKAPMASQWSSEYKSGYAMRLPKLYQPEMDERPAARARVEIEELAASAVRTPVFDLPPVEPDKPMSPDWNEPGASPERGLFQNGNLKNKVYSGKFYDPGK